MIGQTTLSDLLSFCPYVASLRLESLRVYYLKDIWDKSIIKEFLSMNSLGFFKNFCPDSFGTKAFCPEVSTK